MSAATMATPGVTGPSPRWTNPWAALSTRINSRAVAGGP